MKKILVFALISSLALACKSDCDSASDDITAKYAECGIEAAEGEEGEEVECTEELGTQMLCMADCYAAADCAALDGTDAKLALELGTCLVDCTVK